MRYEYCPNCEKKMGFKRSLGWGTFFAIIVTCGFWLLALPFYPLRCMGCGSDSYQSEWELTDAERNLDLDKLAEKMRKTRKS
jgi:hypothetical protein